MAAAAVAWAAAWKPQAISQEHPPGSYCREGCLCLTLALFACAAASFAAAAALSFEFIDLQPCTTYLSDIPLSWVKDPALGYFPENDEYTSLSSILYT